MTEKNQKQIEKAIDWCERKADTIDNVGRRVAMAAWRFSVDETDLLNAYRKFKGGYK